jgi:multidrug efflux pump subunit AcrA (membrane-fusion protein)
MTATRKKYWLRTAGLLLAAGVLVLAGAWAVRPWISGTAKGATPEGRPGEEAAAGSIPVQVVRPRLDPNFAISVTQPAYVEPYYRIDLRARVAGPVLYVSKDIGDGVQAGEELIKISVPDLVQDVAKKDAVVRQRQRELEVARAMRLKAEADVQIARSAVKEKESDVRVADATTAFRKQELGRFRGLASDRTITENVVAERQKFYEAAEAAGASARAVVEKARADEMGAHAKLQEAIADEKLKEALIEVARKDLAQAQELLGFATLRAPFDGVITRRNVDPGSFVQNSAASPGPGLMTIERSEVVTVYMSLPDNYAPYVDDKTEAVVEMSELPGVLIRARLTRFAPSLQTPAQDRTMRVEVDLYNRGPKAYQAFLAREKASHYADLKGGKLPVFPEVSSRLKESLGVTRLLPGMYGTMKLVLHNFKNAHLIPSQALFSKGGKSYLFVVRDGVAHLVPVDVQVDDGILAKVVVVEGGARVERRRELTGEERIVLCNQGELSDGQPVKASLEQW